MAITFSMSESEAHTLWVSDFLPALRSLIDVGQHLTPFSDDASNPMSDGTELSSTGTLCLLGFSAARDCLMALGHLTEGSDAHTVPFVAAPFSLLRAALEALARAAWLVEPQEAIDRRIRAVVLLADEEANAERNVAAYREWQPKLVVGPPSGHAGRYLRGIGKHPKFTSSDAIRSLDIVLERHAGPAAKCARWSWTLASGFAHCQSWTFDRYSASRDSSPSEAGLVTRTFSGQWTLLDVVTKTTLKAHNSLLRDVVTRGVLRESGPARPHDSSAS